MVKLLATCCYIGYLPLMPGTWASIAALPIYYFLKGNHYLLLLLTLILLILGFWASSKFEEELKAKDPREIVIDEFSSQLLVFVFIPFSWANLLLGFFLFRILDVLKIAPVRKLQHFPRGYGIMLDDIAVAIFVNLILRVKVCL